MQTLSVLGFEDGALVAASPTGERFRIPVDDELRAVLREADSRPQGRRLSPREIQAHIRAGLSAEQVAALTGASVADVERFVGPVLAERAYIVESALAVKLPPEIEGGSRRSFGTVMAERLKQLAARDVVWSSAKEPEGWIVQATFTADEIEHGARWRFDPKRRQLTAENTEAATLSQLGTPAALTPRLRALEPTTAIPVIAAAPPEHVAQQDADEPDTSRFDSAIFAFPDLKPAVPDDEEPADTVPEPEPEAPAAPHASVDHVESLDRRRAERQPSIDTASLPVTGATDAVDLDDAFATLPEPVRPAPGAVTRGRFPEPVSEEPEPEPAKAERPMKRPRPRANRPATDGRSFTRSVHADPDATQAIPVQQAPRSRRSRQAMPSWDEIVFGREGDQS